jgi:hypothetical protein
VNVTLRRHMRRTKLSQIVRDLDRIATQATTKARKHPTQMNWRIVKSLDEAWRILAGVKDIMEQQKEEGEKIGQAQH